MTTTGCAPSGSELYNEAREVHSSMNRHIAELQLHVFDGEWEIGGWGVAPETCGANGYRFSFARSTPLDDGWWLPQPTIEGKADDLMAWLDQHGWSDIRLRTYTGGVSSVTIEARKPSGYIDDLLITISAGTANDIVDLRVVGSCEPGNQAELREFMFPNGTHGDEIPERAHPSIAPPFGVPAPSPTPTPEP